MLKERKVSNKRSNFTPRGLEKKSKSIKGKI